MDGKCAGEGYESSREAEAADVTGDQGSCSDVSGRKHFQGLGTAQRTNASAAFSAPYYIPLIVRPTSAESTLLSAALQEGRSN
uniref:Uncharacterized protein n=1 Tax=Physcomitrium patens TaxID=3218 RepID=A0A2K1L3W0_PHYPA|nr:hypothetical protein PHYPA_003496 [Physcomitrium patens]